MALAEPGPPIWATPVEALGIMKQLSHMYYALSEFLSQRIQNDEQIRIVVLNH